MKTSVLIGIPCLKTGGTEIQTLRLVQALVGNGYHCVTVCYFEYDFAMVQAYEQAGSRVVCLSAYGSRPTGSAEVFRFLKSGLKRVVSEYRPKIAHIQYMAPGAIPIIILRQLGVKTIIATTHTDASIYGSLRIVHLVQRRLVTAFTCVTETAERSFFGSSQIYNDSIRLQKHNHFTIYNCLEPNVQPKVDAIDTSQKTIGVVARLVPIKGVDLVMPAFAKVLERHPDSRLLIVGDGSERDVMQRQQSQLGIAQDRVVWTGMVGHHRLRKLYGQMSQVWIPSRSEGFGLTAIEAMSLGRVVVASATGGLCEIVDNGNDGSLFCNGDADDLAAKSIALFDSPDGMRRIGANAVSKACLFSFENYSHSVCSLYSKL